MKNTQNRITKPEIRFWLAIIVLAVSGAVAFTNLKNSVTAMYDKGIKLRKDYDATAEVLREVRDSQIRMEGDIGFIYKELGGDERH